MTWVTFDDGFPDHRKVSALSDSAFRLHVAGICHCNKHLSDGLVDAEDVPRLVRRFRRQALNELVERGLWVEVGTEAGVAAYSIHDFLDWNLSREKVLARREKAASRMRRRRGDAQ